MNEIGPTGSPSAKPQKEGASISQNAPLEELPIVQIGGAKFRVRHIKQGKLLNAPDLSIQKKTEIYQKIADRHLAHVTHGAALNSITFEGKNNTLKSKDLELKVSYKESQIFSDFQKLANGSQEGLGEAPKDLDSYEIKKLNDEEDIVEAGWSSTFKSVKEVFETFEAKNKELLAQLRTPSPEEAALSAKAEQEEERSAVEEAAPAAPAALAELPSIDLAALKQEFKKLKRLQEEKERATREDFAEPNQKFEEAFLELKQRLSQVFEGIKEPPKEEHYKICKLWTKFLFRWTYYKNVDRQELKVGIESALSKLQSFENRSLYKSLQELKKTFFEDASEEIRRGFADIFNPLEQEFTALQKENPEDLKDLLFQQHKLENLGERLLRSKGAIRNTLSETRDLYGRRPILRTELGEKFLQELENPRVELEKRNAAKIEELICSKRRILERFDAKDTYCLKDFGGGGNCLFHSMLGCISAHAECRDSDYARMDHMALRQAIVEEIENNYQKYAEHVQNRLFDPSVPQEIREMEEEEDQKQAYLDWMREETVWGGMAEIQALSNLLKLPILCMQQISHNQPALDKTFFPESFRSAKEALVLMNKGSSTHSAGGVHFQGIVPITAEEKVLAGQRLAPTETWEEKDLTTLEEETNKADTYPKLESLIAKFMTKATPDELKDAFEMQELIARSKFYNLKEDAEFRLERSKSLLEGIQNGQGEDGDLEELKEHRDYLEKIKAPQFTELEKIIELAQRPVRKSVKSASKSASKTRKDLPQGKSVTIPADCTSLIRKLAKKGQGKELISNFMEGLKVSDDQEFLEDLKGQFKAAAAKILENSGAAPVELQVPIKEDIVTFAKQGNSLAAFEENIDLEDAHGNTALHWACMRRDLENIKFLLEKDADQTRLNGSGFSTGLCQELGGQNRPDRETFNDNGRLLEIKKLLLEKVVDAVPADSAGATSQMQRVSGLSREAFVCHKSNQSIGEIKQTLEAKEVQTLPNGSLRAQANETRPVVEGFLRQLGISKSPADDGVSLLSDLNLANIPNDNTYKLGECQITGAEIKRLIDETKVTYVEGGNITSDNLRKDVGQLASQDFSDSQFVMVSGPVYIPFKNDLKTLTKAETVEAYSIPGINYAYSHVDKKAFSTGGSVNEAGEQRMRHIMGHVFEKMKRDQVKEPVLSAIGCGAFAGNVQLVPEKWAEAIYDLLAKNDYQFDKVWIALPKIEDSKNFNAFKAALEQCLQSKELKCPIVIADASMMTIARERSSAARVGILNPSDAQAVREGKIGMYWDEGHIALEESLACSSSILLQQIALRHKYAYNTAQRIQLASALQPQKAAHQLVKLENKERLEKLQKYLQTHWHDVNSPYYIVGKDQTLYCVWNYPPKTISFQTVQAYHDRQRAGRIDLDLTKENLEVLKDDQEIFEALLETGMPQIEQALKEEKLQKEVKLDEGSEQSIKKEDLLILKSLLAHEHTAYQAGQITLGNTLLFQIGNERYCAYFTNVYGALVIQEENEFRNGSVNKKLGVKISDEGNILEVRLGNTPVSKIPPEWLEIVKAFKPLAIQNTSEYKWEHGYAAGSTQFKVKVVASGVKALAEYHLQKFSELLRAGVGTYPDPKAKVELLRENLQLQPGIDYGGLSREYLHDLLEGLTEEKEEEQHLHFEKLPNGLCLPQLKGTWTSERQQGFEDLGVLLMYCYNSETSPPPWDTQVHIGRHFDESLFKALLSLTGDEIDEEPLPFNTKLKLCQALVEKEEGEGTKKQMLQYLALEQAPPEDQIRGLTAVCEDEEYMEDYGNPKVKHIQYNWQSVREKIYAELVKEKFLDYEKHLQPIQAIARGMKSVCNPGQVLREDPLVWDQKSSVNPVDFSTKVQGSLDRKKIANSIVLAEASVDFMPAMQQKLRDFQVQQYLNERIQWLKDWIEDKSTSDQEVMNFLKFATGSNSLAKDKKINVTPQVTDLIPLPKAHTCNKVLELAEENCTLKVGAYLTYENNTKENFIKALKFAFEYFSGYQGA